MFVMNTLLPIGRSLPCLRSWGGWRDEISRWPLGAPWRWRRHYMCHSRWSDFWESRSERFCSSGIPTSCCSAADES